MLPTKNAKPRRKGWHRALKFGLRVGAVGLCLLLALIIVIFNPGMMYAHATDWKGNTIYHDAPLQPNFEQRLGEATHLLQASEIYDPNWKLKFCLNDGSNYPFWMEKLRGQAFGWGFHNKVVLMGEMDAKANTVALNGRTWNLTELLAHEALHCYQYHDLGFWKCNPVGNIPMWKFEGYPEYIARKNACPTDLRNRIATYHQRLKEDDNGWVDFEDGSGTVLPYFEACLMVQFCFEVEHLTWKSLLEDVRTEENVRQAMETWFFAQ
jgi:hypothetical protein